MAEDQLRPIVDAIRARLEAELESHLGSLAQTHSAALEEARRAAGAEAERRWSAKLDETRREWDARLTTELAAARAEVERASAEVQHVRDETERLTAEASSQLRRELDDAVAAERARAQADLERAHAERERAQADLERAYADVQRAQSDRERAQSDRERALGDLERAHGELERAQNDLLRMQAELQRAQADLTTDQTGRERTRTDLERAAAELHRAQADLQRAQADLLTAQAEVQRVRAESTASVAETARATDHAARLQAELQKARTASEEMQAQLHDLRAHAQVQPHAHTGAAGRDQPQSIPAAQLSPGLLQALQAIDQSTSLSDALAAVVRGAAVESPRVALLIVNGDVMQEWPVDGVAPLGAGQFRADSDEAGFLADALRTREVAATDGTNGSVPPVFAALPPGRHAIAVPFVLDGQPVAVLYADEGSGGCPPASWRDTVQILGRHASAFLGYLTVMRTAEAMKLVGGGADAGRGLEDEQHGARRYARLLVSEIRMYNDGAVRAGRERGDLLQRLGSDIDRARQLYEQRVPPSPARDACFQQELVQTLAGGDPSLLG
jgi:hypothetical protein